METDKFSNVENRAGIYYINDCISGSGLQIREIEKELLELNWLTKREARHEYFMSKVPRTYVYGNKGLGSEVYTSNDFSFEVHCLMARLNDQLETNFNVCFLNKYDNEQQHLGWHADDFKGMIKEEPIAVVSFGAAREIWVKPKGTNGEIPKDQRILLNPGSLFIMPPGFQDTHLHKIPKHSARCGWRISLTFRSFL